MVESPAPSPPGDALRKLRRRKVVQWSLAYVAGAWGLLQGLEFGVATFHWPEVATRIGAVLAAIGLPVTVTLAWYHGDRGVQRITRIEALILAVLLVTAAIGVRQTSREAAPASGAAATAEHRLALDRRRIAILPFDNLGGNAANLAFVGGVHDTLITLVAKVPGLSVISRSSVLQFADKHPTIAVVAAALHVGSVLEGSVEREGDRLRIQAQLIDARSDTHLWAETYDRRADDLFAVQSEIAQAVAEQLRIRLTQDEAQRLATSLTSKPEAYEHYARGRDFVGRKRWTDAIDELTKAVAIDPAFASAYAQLSLARTWITLDKPDLRRGYLPLAKAAADHALQLDPTLPEGHLALAIYRYRGEFDTEGAASEFERALPGLPNDAVAHEYFGYLRRWQGRWEESTALFSRAAELDPRGEAVKPYILGLVALGRRDAAARAIQAGQQAQPDDVELALWPGDLAVNFSCDLGAFHRVLQKMAPQFHGDPTLLAEEWDFAMQTGDFAEAAKIAEQMAAVAEPPVDDLDYTRGVSYRMAGRRAEAQPYLQNSLRQHLKRLEEWPTAAARAQELARAALAAALLGDRRQAIELARRARVELPEEGGGADRRPTLMWTAAALAQAGERDAAIERVREMFAAPGLYQPAGVWCDFSLAPLRADPRFRDLMAGLGADVRVDPFKPETWPRVSAAASSAAR